MVNLPLGTKIKFRTYLYKSKVGMKTKWKTSVTVRETHGIIAGRRTLAEGHTDYYPDDGNIFYPSNRIHVYLVAVTLTTIRRVRVEDVEVQANVGERKADAPTEE